jgi:hypothetical protein
MTTVDEAVALTCEPSLCGLAKRPHRHCFCGLPMSVDDELCSLCRLEGHEPLAMTRSHARTEDPYAWDGISYPSRRRRPVVCGNPEPYRLLLFATLRRDEPDALRGLRDDR